MTDIISRAQELVQVRKSVNKTRSNEVLSAASNYAETEKLGERST